MGLLTAVNQNKTKLLGIATTVLGFIQAYPGLKNMMSETAFGWTMFVIGIGVSICGFLNSNPSTAPTNPGSDQRGFIRAAMLGLLLALSVGAASVLSGCESIGMVKAETFEQRWAYAQTQVTGLRETSTRALDGKLISSTDMEYVIGVADRTADLLRIAREAAGAGDLSTAEGRLALARGVLTELEAFLASKNTR